MLLVCNCYNFNRTFRELPAAPSDLGLSNEGMGVELSWSDNSDNELGFSIERNRKVGEAIIDGFTEIATVGRDSTSYTDEGPLLLSSVYIYRAFNAAGYSDYSNEASINY